MDWIVPPRKIRGLSCRRGLCRAHGAGRMAWAGGWSRASSSRSRDSGSSSSSGSGSDSDIRSGRSGRSGRRQQPAAASSSQQQRQQQQQQQHQYLLWLVFWNFGFWRTSPQQRITEYLLFGLFFETLVFDEHHDGNKELNKIFYLVGFWLLGFWQTSPQHRIKEYLLCFRSGAYLQPRQNGKRQFQGYIWYQQHQQQKQQQLTNIKATKN